MIHRAVRTGTFGILFATTVLVSISCTGDDPPRLPDGPAQGEHGALVYLVPDDDAEYPGRYSDDELREAGWTLVTDEGALRKTVEGLSVPPAGIVIHRSRLPDTSGVWLFAQAITGTAIGGVNVHSGRLLTHMGVTATRLSDISEMTAEADGPGRSNRTPSPSFRDFWSVISFAAMEPISTASDFEYWKLRCWSGSWQWQYIGPEAYEHLVRSGCSRPTSTPSRESAPTESARRFRPPKLDAGAVAPEICAATCPWPAGIQIVAHVRTGPVSDRT